MSRSIVAWISVVAGGLVLPLSPSFANAQVAPETAQAEATHTLDEVVVTGEAEQLPRASLAEALEAAPSTGGSLGLTVRESPAVVDTITQEGMQDIGARATDEALNRAPGVMASNPATSPGAISMRGFTGAGRAVQLLYDGVRPLEESLFTRVLDSWMFDRIEVLQGPAAVDYGQGALAGVINLVPKHAYLGKRQLAAQAGYGSFHGVRVGADANVPILDNLAVRPVIAYSRSSGYVDDTASHALALTVGTRWLPVERLTVDLAVDHSRDAYDTGYLGTPLVPRAVARRPSGLVRSADGQVLDRSLRNVNYNVADGILDSDTVWLRSRIAYRIGRGWTLSNDAHFYTSDRRFINAEFFGFDADTGLIERSTGIVTHDIRYWVDRLTLRGDTRIGGLRNRMAVGAEYSEVDFFTERRFGTTASVDLRSPVRGRFPTGDDPTVFGSRNDRDSTVATVAISLQDALSLTDTWRLIGGVRYDHVRVDRTDTNLNAVPETSTHIARNFDVVTWRAGSSYDLLPTTQVFAQYSTAAAPPSSLVALSKSSARFAMTQGWSVEGGIKSAFLDDRVALSLSGFYIAQDDILTRSRVDPTVSIQGGKQSSRGGELSLSARPIAALQLDANYTELDARFDKLLDAEGTSLAGRTPQRVPERIVNAFVYVHMPWAPLTTSVGVHHAGRYFTDDANSVEVGAHTTLEAALRYRLERKQVTADFTLRGRNLTNALFAGYTDMAPNQVSIGAPRSVDLLASARF